MSLFLIIDVIVTFGLILYVAGFIFCVAEGADHETGIFWAVILALIFTPFIAIICIYCSPTKYRISLQEKMVEQNDEIIILLKEKDK